MRNSLNMLLVNIPAGAYDMGCADANFDERPVHRVTISRSFRMAATAVTNAQYEQFDPAHRALRGNRGLSCADDEAVVCVSWHEAIAFCEWLSKREGKPYRLPTEAEWEYACRAGTTTPFHTGESLPDVYHRHQETDWNPHPVSLRVGQTPPNAWGLHDMHGIVEEWCLDTYGPYEAGDPVDPVGRLAGEIKVTRGGSHNTEPFFLRSANRAGALAGDRNWMIGFRVVWAERPATKPLPPPPAPRWACGVSPQRTAWSPPADMDRPFFAPPRRFVHVPPNSNGPLYDMHNHFPTVTWCENGDLLAAWFSTNAERGREPTIAAARLRRGAAEWDPADVFFKMPDRNMNGTVLFNDGNGTLWHFNSVDVAGRWANPALVLRTSTDSGASWTPARFIDPEHRLRNHPCNALVRTRAGRWILPCDAFYDGTGGTAVTCSDDGGHTWFDPGEDAPPPQFEAGAQGATAAGVHAAIVELGDGRLLAIGRHDNIEGRSPMSVSIDGGRTWSYSASPFGPILWGQRPVLLRLRDGPLLFCSFTDPCHVDAPVGLTVADAAGGRRTFFGLFAAISEDDGRTWPLARPVTEDRPGTTMRWLGTPIRHLGGDGAASPGMTRELDANHTEPKGYLCATQTPDGMIHLLSSMMHYQFNLAWLKTPPPALGARG